MLVFLKYKGNTRERGTAYELRPKPFGSVNREYDLNTEPNARDYLHAPWQAEKRGLINPLVKMLVILTIYVIESQCPVNSIGVVT